MYAESHDSDILGRARAGDERAFLALYRAAHPGLLRYLSVIVGDAAEEIAASTWVEVGRDLSGFGGALEEFRAWVASIARRRAFAHLEEDASGSAGRGPSGAVPRRGLLAPIQTEAALRMIALLPPQQAEAVLLRSVMHLDDGSAAAVLGIRRATLRRSALRGLRALSRRLDEADAVDGPLAGDSPGTATEPPAATNQADPTNQAAPTNENGPTNRTGRAESTAPKKPTGHAELSGQPLAARRDLTPSCGIEVSS